MTTLVKNPAPEVAPILDAVRRMYEEVALHPTKQFHFPTGRDACLYVGYSEEELATVPDGAVESFAGVGCPFRGSISTGNTVLDVGSGSGVDVILSARRTGPRGKVYGVDMTPAMIDRARENVQAAGLRNVEILEGTADKLPLKDASVDVVTSNGVFNLAPDKQQAFREVYRVLRPGGRIQFADIVLAKAPSDASKANPQLWAECIVGAEPDHDYLDLIQSAGLEDVVVVDERDYFDRSPNESTRNAARGFGARTVVITARKPD